MKKICRNVVLPLIVVALAAPGLAIAQEVPALDPPASVEGAPPLPATEVPTSPADLEILLRQKDQELQALRQEHSLLLEKLTMLQGTPALTREMLTLRNLQRLKDIAVDVKAQRQTMAEFENFVTWMTGNLSGYSRYIEAGSVAAGFARVLPIPYAGQASMFTKFVSQGVLSLNAASVAIKKYLVTSQEFVARVDKLDQAAPNAVGVAEAGRFADEQLLRDMGDLQRKLASAGDVSASTLSFLESLNHYVGSTDEYWNKTKSFLTRSDDKKEKSFLNESITGLKSRAAAFNNRLHVFDEKAKKDVPLIKTLSAYNELIRELDGKVVASK